MRHAKLAGDMSAPQGSARRVMLARAALIAVAAVLLVPWPVAAKEADPPAEPADPPAQPARPVVSAVAHDSVTLSWDDPGDLTITGYQILRRNPSTDAGGVFTVVDDDTGTSATSYTDTTVAASTSYFYRIKARNAHGLSAWSGFVRADVPAAPVDADPPAEPADPPAQPVRPVVSAVAHDSVTLSWDDPGDLTITGYQILRRNPRTDAGGVFTVVDDDTGTSATSYTDTTVAASTSYFYRIKARNVHGLSARSGFVRADVPAAPDDTDGPTDLGNITYFLDAKSATDKLTTEDPSNEYRFTLDLTMTVELNLHALDFDADMVLQDAAAVTVAESRNAGTVDEWISKRLAPGTYSVLVEAQQAGDNYYRLAYEAVNGSTPLNLGDITDRQWDPPGTSGPYVASSVGSRRNRLDYYRFTLNAAKTVHLRLWRQPDQQGDSDLYLENEAGTVIAASQTAGTADELIETNLTAGTWYIAVRPHTAGGAVSYTLSYGVTAPGDHDATPQSPDAGSGTYAALAANSTHACGLRVDGTVACWGANYEGQAEAPEGTFKAIALGSVHSCALRTDGTIACWGDNAFDQTDAPPRTYKAIAANDRTSCAIAIDDTLDCWGYNAFGQADEPAGTFKAVTLGWEHVCALRTDGTIACWGYNDEGETDSPAGTYKAIAAGAVHTCAIATDDTIACWGHPRTPASTAPSGTYKSMTAHKSDSCAIATDDTLTCWGKRIAADAPTGTYKAVAIGYVHSCAIVTDDTLTCWGNRGSGRTDAPAGTYKSVVANQDFSCAIATDDTVTCWGHNANAKADAPTGTYKTVTLGLEHGCAIAPDDTIACWGDNHLGQTDPPAGVYKTVTTGSWHGCAIAPDDTIACWGDDSYGQTDAPAGTYKTLASGADHICAIAPDDTIVCWGRNDHGETDAPAGTYKTVALGLDHSCAIATDDTIACWGRNDHGQTDAPAGTYKTVTTRWRHNCAIATDDTIACWGRNDHGQADPPAGTYKTITVGSSHSCAIATFDTIACWGYNDEGQADSPAGTYKAITLGTFFSCAIATDDTIACWGTVEGQPPGTTVNTYKAVTARGGHTCAIATDDTLVCWPRTPNDVRWVHNPAAVEIPIPGPAAATQLASLSVSGAALDPAFDPEVSLYSVQAAAGAARATVSATASDAGAEVQISPADADTGTVGHQVELTAGGQTAATVSVVAADGTVGRYWLLIDRPADPAQAAPGGKPRLSALLLDGVAPLDYDPATARYETDADADASEATAVLGREDSDAAVEVFTVRGDDPALTLDAADADANAPGHQFGLSASGDTLVLVRITSADGQRQNIYLVLIHNHNNGGSQAREATPSRLERTLADPKGLQIAARNTPAAVLSTLSLGTAVLAPAFSAATTNYTAAVTADVSQVTVSATAATGVNYAIAPGDADPNTAGHQVALLAAQPGGEPAQTVLAVIVSNADGVVSVYLVTVSRAAPPSDDATLSALSIDGVTLAPAFAADTYAYTAVVPNATDQITVTAEPSHSDAEAAISPADADTNTDGHQVDLVQGANTVTVDVTADDEVTTLSYSVTITREPPDDDSALSALSINGVTLVPAFAPGTHLYTATVPSTTAQMTVGLVTSHPSATVTVVPADADPAVDGYQIPLAAPLPGAQSATTAVAIVVTAVDNTTRATYALTVTREADAISGVLPSGCDLEALTLSSGVLTASSIWRPSCRSILAYKESEASSPGSRTTGFARFYRLDVVSEGDVTIGLSEYDTSHHLVLRQTDGTEIKHVFKHLDQGSGPCPEFEYPCSGQSRLVQSLSPGVYLLEVVQHYSSGGRTRRFTVEVTGDAVHARAPQLAALSIDGTAVPLSLNVFRAETERTAAVVTLTAEPETATPAHVVTIEPADADTATEGHQLNVAEYGLTEAAITVSDSAGIDSSVFTLTISGDHEATVATGGSVAVGGSVRARIDSAGDRDWFAVDLVAGTTYRIDLKGSSSSSGTLVDPLLAGVRLADGTLAPGTDDDDGGSGNDSAQWYVASTTGKHFIEAAANGTGTGTYELSVTVPTDDFTANIATTGAVTVDGAAVDGELEIPNDRDWFAVELTANQSYWLNLKGAPSGNGTLSDPQLVGVYDSAGVLVTGTGDSDSGVGANAEEVFVPSTSGTYYVSAGSDDSGPGSYELSVDDVTDGFPDDFAGDASTTGVVSVGASAAGDIQFEGDRDWFEVDLTAGVKYFVFADGSASGEGTLSDPVLYGIHHDGTLVAGTTDDDSGFGTNSAVVFTPSASGTHYVSVGAAAGDRGTYSLSVQPAFTQSVSEASDTDVPADVSTPGRLVTGGSVTGAVAPNRTDEDWFAAHFEAGQWYMILATSYHFAEAQVAGVYDSSGRRLPTSAPDTTGLNRSVIFFKAPATDLYYVAVDTDDWLLHYPSTAYTLDLRWLDDLRTADVSTTGTVGANGTARGTLEYPTDLDWYAVEFVAGKGYRIDLEGHDGPVNDTGAWYLLDKQCLHGVHDASGTLIGSTATCSGGPDGPRQYFSPPTTGTYYISVGSALSGGSWSRVGNYTLRVRRMPDDNPADSSTSSSIAVGRSASGDVQFPGDVDWFAVAVEANRTYWVRAKGWRSGHGTLYSSKIAGVYDPDGMLLADTPSTEGGESDLNTTTTFTTTLAGTYYVGVAQDRQGRPSDPAGTAWSGGTYRVWVEDVTNGYPDDCGQDAVSACTVAVPGSVEGDLEIHGDTDWFAMELTEGVEYEIRQRGVTIGPGRVRGVTLLDPMIHGIYGNDGVKLPDSSDDNGGGDYTASVTFVAPSSGTYHVAAGVSPSNGPDVGTYRVSVLTGGQPQTDDYRGSASTRASVFVGESVRGEVQYGGDRDWFRVYLVADAPYSMRVEGAAAGEGTLADPLLGGVYDRAGILHSTDDDYSGSVDVDSEMTFTPTQTGVFYIEVTGGYGSNGYSLGTYRLTLDTDDEDAASIVVGATTEANIGVGTMADGDMIFGDTETHLYAVPLTAGTDYWIQLDPGTLAHPYIKRVYNDDGTEVMSHSGEPTELAARIHRLSAPVTGTYYIVVNATVSLTDIDDNGVGTYRILVSDMSDTALTAVPGRTGVSALSVGVAQRSDIDSTFDFDRYRVWLEAGTEYQIDMQGAWTGYREGSAWISLGTLVNPLIDAVYADGATTVNLLPDTSHHDAGIDQNDRASFTPQVAGYYLIDVGGHTAWTGTYLLTVTEAP